MSVRWLLKLIVPENEARFREILRSIPYDVHEDGDGCFLAIPAIQHLTNAQEATEQATWILTLVNMGIRWSTRKEDEVEATGLYRVRDDGTKSAIILSGLVEIRVDGQSALLEDGKEVNRIAKRTAYVDLMLGSDVVPRVIQLAESGLNPGSMYNILEGISGDMGGTTRQGFDAVAERGWLSVEQLSLLKHCLNHPVATGLESRHVFTIEEPPKDPMSLDEIRRLVRHLLHQWIAWRLASNSTP